ncbi:hypothetical protein NUD23_002725 [Listeria monocytogenes]|uniref:hypothetical protein n=1 Tax=Listeria innocua TaxID=1642 RepID=UPI00165DA65B|nr:hypothetical protein [Listeria innocua]EJO8710372.1 hypothetical protein [Listeria monocytogenes]EJQ6454893.1 hypothetical protein [Listeria monocytogenes]EJR7071900.1 hypothetical protein [Listeria monocytogenes]UVW23994.1 helix-turn-helix transcriptional regulator [Listeria innocua]HDI4651633.1 hypothetical protein [Listeria monocytogenes]
MAKHAIDELLQAYQKNRNQFAVNQQINPNSVNNYAKRNTKVEKIPSDVLNALAKELNISMDEVYEQLLKYQSEN